MMCSSSWRGALGLIFGILVWMAPTSAGAGAPDEAKLRKAEELKRDYERLRNKGKHDKASVLAEQACSILEEELGGASARLADCINGLGNLYRNRGAYDKAELSFQRALSIRKKTLGPDHPDVATVLNDLALLYTEQGEYEKAEPLYEQALAIYEQTLDPLHPRIAMTLNNLATLYYLQGEYKKAEPLLDRTLTVLEKELGPYHPKVATAINNLAILYESKGAYNKAKPLLERALAIEEEVLGQHHPDVATALNNLAGLNKAQGSYRTAESLYERALAIEEKELGPDHPGIAITINNLADLYNAQGEYEKAEPLYKQALHIEEKGLGPNHPNVASILLGLAALYDAQGAYEKAEPLYERALTIEETELGPHHPGTASTLNLLAGMYRHQGKDDRAELLYGQALAINKKTLGSHHPNIAINLNNLALLHHEQGAYEKAEPLYQEALTISKEALGLRHPNVAITLNNLANLYRDQGAYKKAESLYQQALSINKEVLWPHHPDVAINLSNIARLNHDQGHHDSALNSHRQSLDIEETNLARSLIVADESRKLAYASTMSRSLHYTLSLHLRVTPEYDSTAELALTTLLRRKNRVQDLVTQSTSVLRRSLPEDARHLLDDLSDVDSRIAALSSREPGKLSAEAHTQQLGELRQQRNRLWSELARHSAIIEALDHPITIEDVQRTLSAGSALVELIQYVPQHDDAGVRVRAHEPKLPPRYAAYLVFPDRFDWVDLGPAAPIDERIRTFRTALQNKQAIPTDLYDAVMRPIVDKLGSTHRLVIAPAGRLSHVPFGALYDGERYLIEQYDLRYVTTGRDLLDPPASPPVTTPVTIIANPTGSHLRDAELEADFLEGFFPNTRVLRREQATETNVRTVERPLILHMATHGFFGQPRNERDNPMLRSGLRLADIEQVDVDRELDDGRLTAYEVSGMDLRGTQLVVLSACETGMGAVDVTKSKTGNVDMSEGVFGLRRAFAMAGARTTVMSLWQVSGMTAQRTMDAYYRKLAEGQGPGEAMQAVQLEMLHTEEHRHPKDWAAFVVSGDDDPLVFPAGQEPRELDPGPPPVRGARGCTIDATRSNRGLPGTLLLGLLGLAALRRRDS